MSRSLKLAALAVLGTGLLWNCSGGSTTTAQLSISAKPGTIDNKGEASTLTVEGTDETGKPGSGSVTVSSSAGSLRDAGQMSVTLDSKGQGTLQFTCAASADRDCDGSVKISAEWARTGGAVFNSRFIQVGGAGGGGGTGGGGGGGGGVGGAGGGGGFTGTECLGWTNALYFDGADSGYIYKGQLLVTAGVFSLSGSAGSVGFAVTPASPSQGSFWHANFAGPQDGGKPLAVGVYKDAGRFASAEGAGLDVGGDGRGCNESAGQFEVQRISSFPDAGIAEFAASFEQFCERSPRNLLRGCVHFTSPFAQPDGGSVDGGTGNTVTLTPLKQALVIGTGDSTELTAKVTVTATGAVVAATPVSFSTDRGSFAAAPGTTTMVVMSDAQGNAKVVLSTAGATAGVAAVTASALDGVGRANVGFVGVASIVAAPDMTVKTTLGIQSGGRETTTPVLFKVLDAANMPSKDVQVSFATGTTSPGGTSVTPSGVSDAMGIVRTTLQSGNAVGVVTVVATVTATAGLPSPISASTTVQIVGGKPSFRGLVVNCGRKNLSALTNPGSVNGIPTRPLMTDCTANLSDRFTNPVGLPTQVSWFAERGTIGPSTSAAGIATSVYGTTSNAPPNDVAPLTSPVEPVNGTRNPRDMIISIIGVVGGEEEFTDVNANGKWEPGEWFLDLPEPFVDDNDNQKWDLGEAKIDTDRLNCATGMVELPNGIWDGPNGCWDANTQIFATTHVVWSGTLSQPIVFAQPPPWTVQANQVRLINFTWSDDWFNPMSPDAPAMSVTLIPSIRGGASVSAPGLLGDGLGHGIAYEKVEATETAAGSGTFTINGICDASKPGPTNPLTRCLSRYRFASFGAGNSGQLQLTGGMPQGPLPDGGIAQPVTATVTISGQNMFFTPASQSFSATFE